MLKKKEQGRERGKWGLESHVRATMSKTTCYDVRDRRLDQRDVAESQDTGQCAHEKMAGDTTGQQREEEPFSH